MKLQNFLPYRLAVLAETVSQAMAAVYRERFGLTRDEWRVLAQLAELGEARTAQVIERTTLEKMQVSRAVTRLERDGLLTRSPDPDDGRGHVLAITPAGRTLYGRVVPMVLAREQFLLEALGPGERERLLAAMAAMQQRAEQLLRQG